MAFGIPPEIPVNHQKFQRITGNPGISIENQFYHHKSRRIDSVRAVLLGLYENSKRCDCVEMEVSLCHHFHLQSQMREVC